MTAPTPTPAYTYGHQLGQLRRGMERFMQEVVAGFTAGVKPAAELTLEEREARSIVAYRRRIEQERQAGIRFVRREAARARRELGLSDHG